MPARANRKRLCLTAVLWGLSAAAAPADSSRLQLPAAQLGFEQSSGGGAPFGWVALPPGTTFVDFTVKHGGQSSLRLERSAGGAGEFSTVLRGFPIDFTGTQIELRGWLRREGAGVPSLWMRQDEHDTPIAFVDMSAAPDVTGEWARYSVSFDLQDSASALVFGVRQVGNGKAWADDLELLVDGQPIANLPRVVRQPGALDVDQQFADGSGLVLGKLGDDQVKALALVGKVWGFLKYHHPAVTAGKRHWDFDLLRKLPALMVTGDGVSARGLLIEWIDSLGAVPPCKTCASLPSDDLQLPPRLAWIEDPALVGKELGQRLQAIYRARVPGQQFYVRLAPGVGNPQFEHELLYPAIKLPDSGFQVLAIYRFWNAIEYWFPYRDLIDENWDAVLEDTLRRAAPGAGMETYQRELMRLIARVGDGHANMLGTAPFREPVGECQLPVNVRHLEGRFVVQSLAADDEAAHLFQVGDVLTTLGGKSADEIVAGARDSYGASNDAWRMFSIARNFTRGPCGPVNLTVQRGGEQKIAARRVPPSTLKLDSNRHDRDGDTFQMLSPQVAYLKLSSIKAADVAGYIQRAANAKSLVIDIRNYPAEFVVFALGTLLVDKETPFATFTVGDLSNPGAFAWGTTMSLTPAAPHFGGNVAILVDESTISSAEYHAMALRASPRARIFGARTAGADGNLSQLLLPGRLAAGMSGIGVFYPDKRPTQRRGVAIDVECPQTIAGLRAGRDEVLQCALKALGAR
jgi:C-terminal processing protease CtpA/Prc